MPSSKKHRKKLIVQAKLTEEVDAAGEDIKDFDTDLSAMAQGIQTWLDSLPKSSQSTHDQPTMPLE